jgi:putative ABC transport system permease protein
VNWLTALDEGFRIALSALRANKVRSGLTILGVGIGVLVVMVIAAVIQGVNGSFTEAISSRGVTTFYVVHASFGVDINTGYEEEESDFMTNPPLEPEMARELARLPEIQDVWEYADLSQSGFEARRGTERAEIALVAVTDSYLEFDNGDLVDGRWFTSTENSRARNVAVIDSAAALDLFEGRDPVGQDFVISSPGDRVTGASDAPFRIVGVYRPPANLFAGFATHYVFIPFSTAYKDLDIWDRLIGFAVRPNPGVTLEEALDAVEARMREIRGLSPGQESNFSLITQDEVLDLWNQLTGVLFTVMVALSSVGLMVGGVGVIGIMMISVTERTREIGLRKSMGARRRDILWQFLVEASTLTLIGGFFGLFLGGAIVYGLNRWSPIPAEAPLWAIVVALAASALTGIGFGLFPASRGARLDPVEALRYE